MRRLAISLAALLALASPASALSIFYTVASPGTSSWTTISAPLSEGAWRVDSYTGPLATQAQVQWVLGHLTAMYVLQEWWSSTGDDSNLDNVHFGSGASSSFASSSEGWFAAGPFPTSDIAEQSVLTQPLLWDSVVGNPAGSARITSDLYTWTYFAAPAAYLGNQSARYGETLGADLFIRVTDNIAYPVFALVAPDVPEPSALALLGAGCAALLAARRRARS